MLTILSLVMAFAWGQSAEKVLIASIEPERVERGSVAELLWHGNELVVLIAVPNGRGHDARFYALPGPGVELRRLAEPPATRDEYWKRKASRVSPTGLGRIAKASDAQLPMMGVGSLEQRLANAANFGGMAQTFEVRLGDLVLYTSGERDPYDGEVWAWSPAEVNRIAYVDGKRSLRRRRRWGGGATDRPRRLPPAGLVPRRTGDRCRRA